MSRDGLDGLMQRISAALPGFVPDRHVRSLKCLLVFGEHDGERVCVKALDHADPVWAWYFEREREILARLPDDVGAPRLRACSDGLSREGLLVVDELPGQPLSRHRRLARPLSRAVLGSCLELAERVQAIAFGELAPPKASIRRALRRRLLEDPSAPLGWFHDGCERCATLGIVSSAQARSMHAALEGYPEIRGCHGDFLPRNLLVDEQLRVSACDWECAGLHARDWDRALLWANSGELERAQIEESVAGSSERERAFRALTGFALARELAFARRAPQARRGALARQLAEQLRGC